MFCFQFTKRLKREIKFIFIDVSNTKRVLRFRVTTSKIWNRVNKPVRKEGHNMFLSQFKITLKQGNEEIRVAIKVPTRA